MSEFGPKGEELLKQLKEKVDILYNSLDDIYKRLDKLENNGIDKLPTAHKSYFNDFTEPQKIKPPTDKQIWRYNQLFGHDPPEGATSADVWKSINEETKRGSPSQNEVTK